MRSGTGHTVSWLAGLAAVGLLAAVLVPSQLFLSLASQASIYAIYALGVGMLVRQSGMVSFGHAAFFGLPAYVVAILAANQAVRFELALVIAVGATAAVAARSAGDGALCRTRRVRPELADGARLAGRVVVSQRWVP